MAYDFSMPIIQGLLARRALEEQAATEEPKPLLSLLSNPEQTAPAAQSPPQPQQSPQSQEPLDGKQMIDVSMANALDIPQAPNSYALNVQRGLLTQKQAYADAKTDAEKAKAHSTAEILRNKANAAGIDVSGYGSDVSLGDAVNNLASQEARDIMGALQGYYSRDSGQYYNDEYWRGIERGLSPRKAQKVAEALTGSYKADRVNYLDGLLNSYGRADTALANQILASMIPESPALAQFYTLTNPTPLNEYNTAVDVAKEAANQSNALQLLGETFKNRLGEIEAQTAGNIKYMNAEYGNRSKLAKQTHGYDRENAYDSHRYNLKQREFQGKIDAELAKLAGAITRKNQTNLADLEYGNWVMQEDYKQLLQDKDFQRKVAQYSVLADWLGYKGENKKAFMTAAFGIKMPDPNTGTFDKASIENGKKFHGMLDADEGNILKQLEQDPDNPELLAMLADIRTLKQELEDKMGDQLGLQSLNAPAYTGDLNKDIPTIEKQIQLMRANGASNKEMSDKISKWVRETNPEMSDIEIQSLILMAEGHTAGGK